MFFSSRVYVTIDSMDLRDIFQVLPGLRARLLPLEAAPSLVDVLEGERPDARKSAVLLALFAQDGETHLAFIRRASTLRAHSGEIAFPGGSYDQEDASLVATALREAFEEIGLPPARVEVLGLLSPVFTVVSNFLILPVVAYLPSGPGPLLAAAAEVAEVLLLPLNALADPAIAHTEIWSNGGRTRPVYFYDYGSLRIWGATGRILANLLMLLQEV
jgi:8-oxo-dGTP pyrophosphatase MutT (NUDIX family)